jgi:hypothetical protein
MAMHAPERGPGCRLRHFRFVLNCAFLETSFVEVEFTLVAGIETAISLSFSSHIAFSSCQIRPAMSKKACNEVLGSSILLLHPWGLNPSGAGS